MEKTVYFVRHGQSVDNALPVFQSPDSPLSDLGLEQADSIAKRVARIEFESLLSSPWERAKQTAEVIGRKTGKVPEFSNLFVEVIKPSSINGRPHDDLVAAETKDKWTGNLNGRGIKIEDGENFDDITSRADEALRFLENRKEKAMVVVTHGYFFRTMMARILLGDTLTPEIFKQYQYALWMDNTGLSVMKYGTLRGDRRWRLWVYNDHSHLG